jgi:hypothetical protein
MGLGASTVVRLEGALAHEVLRYCTAIRGSCAEVVRVQRRAEGCRWCDGSGDPSAGWITTLIGCNRKPATPQCCREDTGRRKQPSTQAWSTVREPAGQGQTRGVLPQPLATESGQTGLWWCDGAISVRRHAGEQPIL